MKRFLILAGVLLAGCALSPTQLREQGDQSTYVMSKPAAAAASCVARNAENTGGTFTRGPNTSVRDGQIPGQIELVMYIQDRYFLVADFQPTGSGSTATAWVSPNTIEYMKARLLETFKGC